MYEYSVNNLALCNGQERIAIIHYLEFKARDDFDTVQIQ